MTKQIHTSDPTAVSAALAASNARAARALLGHRRDDALVRRVRGEYLEMPGLNLTLDQAQRMWNLRRDECEGLLDDLVSSGFLTRTRLGYFVLAGSGSAGA